MTSHFDDRETRAPDAREQETFDGLRSCWPAVSSGFRHLLHGLAIPIPRASSIAPRWQGFRSCASPT
jgi:hypothetical protein